MSDRFKRYTIHMVDVFTATPLTGKQLAVVLDAEGIPAMRCNGSPRR